MKPLSPSIEQRKEYAQAAFAISSFMGVQRQIELYLKLDKSRERDLCVALNTSILVHYLNPFKMTKDQGLRLDREFVPPEFQSIHKDMETQRDKVVAHRDLNLKEAEWGSPNDIGFIVHPDGSLMHAVYDVGIMSDEKARELNDLLESLLKKLCPRIGQFFSDNLQLVMPSGHYVVSLKNKDPWYRPAASS